MYLLTHDFVRPLASGAQGLLIKELLNQEKTSVLIR